MPEQITFIRSADVLRRTGLRRSTLYRKIKAGIFPRPFPISERGRAWREDAIDEYNRLVASGSSNAVIADYCNSVMPPAGDLQKRSPRKTQDTKMPILNQPRSKRVRIIDHERA